MWGRGALWESVGEGGLKGGSNGNVEGVDVLNGMLKCDERLIKRL